MPAYEFLSRMQHAAAYYELKAKTVAALAHPLRLEILEVLSAGEASTSDLVRALGVPQPLVSQHLAVLRSVGVVARQRQDRRHVYVLADPGVAAACALMGEIVARLALREQVLLTPTAVPPTVR